MEISVNAKQKGVSKFPGDILNNTFLPAAHAKYLGLYIKWDLNFQHHTIITLAVCNYICRFAVSLCLLN